MTEHRTPAGRLSMDPAKWNVCRFEVEDLWEPPPGSAQHSRVIGSIKLWGVYPPGATEPSELHFFHVDAINKASRYAMFAVVPPDNISINLQDSTIRQLLETEE